jgi:hypothetical protein
MRAYFADTRNGPIGLLSSSIQSAPTVPASISN